VSVAEITRIIKAQDEIPSTDDQKTPSLAPSTDNARKNNHTASPSPHEKHGCRRRDGNAIDDKRRMRSLFSRTRGFACSLTLTSWVTGNDAQKCPEAPDIGSGAEFSRSPIGAANPYRLLEKKPLLPTVDLDKTLLYDENQQDLLAGELSSFSRLHCSARCLNLEQIPYLSHSTSMPMLTRPFQIQVPFQAR
jgi:hypothetical protein